MKSKKIVQFAGNPCRTVREDVQEMATEYIRRNCKEKILYRFPARIFRKVTKDGRRQEDQKKRKIRKIREDQRKLRL